MEAACVDLLSQTATKLALPSAVADRLERILTGEIHKYRLHSGFVAATAPQTSEQKAKRSKVDASDDDTNDEGGPQFAYECINMVRQLTALLDADSDVWPPTKDPPPQVSPVLQRLLAGEIDDAEISRMINDATYFDMRWGSTAYEHEEAFQREERGSVLVATSDQIKCGHCGARSTAHYSQQTRSGDEPMTTFIQCTKCGNRWRR